ncbi:Enoyl-(Acyl carrier protein) reductase [Rhizoctonia solani]|uniref:Enoyl-(Acyl carrier protein) reductase n=1 Tax=Rhizoctonia solani TaxID=456999 RepID=A0A8H7IIV2_9AGAM|nr:Enoyl-(Acyl carrier protein) reductase [Rhizoctonia solani]
MPYSQDAHNPLVSSLLSTLSYGRMIIGNFLATFYPEMTMPIADLSGKVAIITGANSGIGLETARALAGMGAQVVLACRNKSKGEEAKKQIIESTGNLNIELEILDCASFANVHAFLARWKKRESRKVDILINNAGEWAFLCMIPKYRLSYRHNIHLKEGSAIQLLSLKIYTSKLTKPTTCPMFLLTYGLLNAGCMAPNGRIISVSSIAYYMSDPLNRDKLDNRDILARFNNQVRPKFSLNETGPLYRRSKAAQVMWSMALQRRLSKVEGWKGITVHSCHPGLVKTAIWSQPTASIFGISNKQGAINAVWLAVAPEPASHGMEGLFWDRMEWRWVKPWILDVSCRTSCGMYGARKQMHYLYKLDEL